MPTEPRFCFLDRYMASSVSYILDNAFNSSLKPSGEMDNGEAMETTVVTYPFTAEDSFTDVTLEVEGQLLFTNRSILAYASPVFNCMFTSEFKEKNDKLIPLPDKDYQSVSELLAFVHPGVGFTLSRDSTFRLVPLAEEYQIPVLKSACEDFLCRDVKRQLFPTAEYIVRCLEVAESSGLHKLKNLCTGKLTDPDMPLTPLKGSSSISLETKSKIFEGRIEKMEKEKTDIETWRHKVNNVKQRLRDIISPHEDHCRCRVEVKLRSPIQKMCPYCSRTFCSDHTCTDPYRNSYQFYCNHRIGYNIAHDATIRTFLDQVEDLIH